MFQTCNCSSNELNLLPHPLVLKAGCIRRFSYVYTINQILLIPLSYRCLKNVIHQKEQFRTACKNFTTKIRTEPILQFCGSRRTKMVSFINLQGRQRQKSFFNSIRILPTTKKLKIFYALLIKMLVIINLHQIFI